MKTTVGTARLSAALKAIAPAVAGRPSQPILAGVRISEHAEGLELTGYDFETEMRSRVPVDELGLGVGGEPEALVVSHGLLSRVIAVAGARESSLELVGPRVVIRSGRGEWTLPTMPVEDYPNLPLEVSTSAKVDGDLFARAVSIAAAAASRDESLPALTAVLLRSEGEHLTLAATDRYRFFTSEVRIEQEAGAEPIDQLLRASLLDRATAGLTGAAEIGCSGGLFRLHCGTLSLATRVMDVQFPQWRQFFEPLHNRCALTVELDRKELLDALKQATATAAATDKDTRVILQASGGELVIEGGIEPESVGNSSAVIGAQIGGDHAGIRLAISGTFLEAAAAATTAPKVVLSFTVAGKPVGIGAPGALPALIIMPIRVPDDRGTGWIEVGD